MPLTLPELLLKKAGAGIDFAVLCRPSFWWFDHFSNIDIVLDGIARRVLSTSRAMAYDFRGGSDGAGMKNGSPQS